METASLTLAHNHARLASQETQKANASLASEEHELAAGEFSKAAKDIHDYEALRVLKLLEGHHQHLAHIIKAQSTRLPAPASAEQPPKPEPAPSSTQQIVDPPAANAPSAPQTPTPAATSPEPPAQPPSTTTPARRTLKRQSSSSIATNLATARGIPGQQHQQRRGTPITPTVSRDSAGGRILRQQRENDGSLQAAAERRPSTRRASYQNPEKTKDAGGGVSGGSTATNGAALTAPHPLPGSEEPFQRFFNTFETLFTKLSAPLAFASLPLNPLPTYTANNAEASSARSPKPPSNEVPVPRTSQPPPAVDPSDPDLSTLISRAALRALRDDHPALGPGESFYVVPTSGGTVSYAGIVARGDGSNSAGGVGGTGDAITGAHLAEVPEEEAEGLDDEFVDASETPYAGAGGSASPTSLRAPHARDGHHGHHHERGHSGASSRAHSRRITGGSSGGGGAPGLHHAGGSSLGASTASVATMTPAAAGAARGRGPGIGSGGGGGTSSGRKTREELELENAALKSVLDQQSRRLHMWEAASQSQSAALAMSFRAWRDGGGGGGGGMGSPGQQAQAAAEGVPPVPRIPERFREAGGTGTEAGMGGGTTETKGTEAEGKSGAAAADQEGDAAATPAELVSEHRLRELEEQLAAARRDNEQLARDNERAARDLARQEKMVLRYRELWERLKAGAKRRERAAAEAAATMAEAVETTGSPVGEGEEEG
ncbi:hypothetical protein BDY21DRAFT_372550 [Lineolata rhizophorae]|uniref:Uncharacterized protein n=1 Tax=Lineolata rhizophorae TaxID=578093 RepID=A0A6A6NXH1_9PEZI|nr:hypothetical protein BDY21DRAFT_372550 [Lineolata rhizophorae]